MTTTTSNGSHPHSHPAIRFEKLPLVYGPLLDFERNREKILSDVTEQALRDLARHSPDFLLEESLFKERLRLKRARTNLFTKGRAKHDRSTWSGIQAGLMRPSAEVDRKAL